MKFNFYILLYSLISLFNINSMPKYIILIRHGEKITDDLPILSLKGQMRAYALAPYFAPDEWLAPWFASEELIPSDINPNTVPPNPPKPSNVIKYFSDHEASGFKYKISAIYAQSDKGGKSQRPYDTVKPLANLLNQTINSNFVKNDMTGLMSALKDHNGDIVLICWEHDAIAELIAPALGADPNIEAANKNIDSNIVRKKIDPKTNKQVLDWGKAFDVVWIVTLNPDGTFAKLDQLKQQLLFGDSN